MKQLILKLAEKAILWGLGILYDHIDLDDDGKIDQTEIQEFVIELDQHIKYLRR